ncbi:glycerophosphodiester phosphodiesterase family protein [Bacillus licheniformis]|nr:glycerophosphodiester phosphodiesterase family protein [Bacillus licheniformis]
MHTEGLQALSRNTMAAFKHAAAIGADGIELDVQMAKTDVLLSFMMKA